MSKNNCHSLSGSWRGHYSYTSGRGTVGTGRCGFEAVFIEENGAVDGNILDDGRLGESNVSGTFGYPKLQFTKAYYNSGLMPVKYQGSMSEDGNTLTGTWNLTKRTYGIWVAKRHTDVKELDIDKADSVELETEPSQKKLLVHQSR